MKEPNILLDAPRLQTHVNRMGKDARPCPVVRCTLRRKPPIRTHKTHPAADAGPVRKSPLKIPVGSAIFSSQVWEQIAHNLKLSGRELQIVRGTFDDLIESAMAAELQIATSTVHTHVQRLHRKLAVPDRAQLLLRVMQEFIVLSAPPGKPPPLTCANPAMGRRLLRPNR